MLDELKEEGGELSIILFVVNVVILSGRVKFVEDL